MLFFLQCTFLHLSKVHWGRPLPTTPCSSQQHQCQQERQLFPSKIRRDPGKTRLAKRSMANCAIALYICIKMDWGNSGKIKSECNGKVVVLCIHIKENFGCLTVVFCLLKINNSPFYLFARAKNVLLAKKQTELFVIYCGVLSYSTRVEFIFILIHII